MADGVAITAGTGTTILTDDTGAGGHAQVMKLAISTDGSGTLIPADATNGMDVDVTRLPNEVVDNAEFTDGTTKLAMVGFVYDETAGTPLTENDAAAARVDAKRSQVQTIEDGATRGRYATVTASNALKVDGSAVTQPVSGAVVADVSGEVAHDAVDSGDPVKIGAKAIAHGTNPTQVASADRTNLYANRHGILFTIGGHPAILTKVARITGAQTDAPLFASIITAGTKMVITRLTINVSNACTVNVGIKIGFGTATIQADSSSGTTGVVIDNDGWPPGGGIVLGNGGGMLAVGGDDEELRITNDAPTGGAFHVSVTYYLIES
jgi:hypothetical protein